MSLGFTVIHIFSRNTMNLGLFRDGKTSRIYFRSFESPIPYTLQYYFEEENYKSLLLLFERKIAKGFEVRMIYDGVGSFLEQGLF